MPTNENETVTATESCMKVASFVPDSNVNSIPTVGLNTKISALGEM